MTENYNDIPEYEPVPAKKNNKTLWIILAVLAAVILCCCVLAVVGSLMYLPTWTNEISF